MTYAEGVIHKEFMIAKVMCCLDIAAYMLNEPDDETAIKAHKYFDNKCPNIPQDLIQKLVKTRRIENHHKLFNQWEKLFFNTKNILRRHHSTQEQRLKQKHFVKRRGKRVSNQNLGQFHRMDERQRVRNSTSF